MECGHATVNGKCIFECDTWKRRDTMRRLSAYQIEISTLKAEKRDLSGTVTRLLEQIEELEETVDRNNKALISLRKTMNNAMTALKPNPDPHNAYHILLEGLQ